MSAYIERIFWLVLFFIQCNDAYLLMLPSTPKTQILKTMIREDDRCDLNMCHFFSFFFSFQFEIRYFIEWLDVKSPNTKHTWIHKMTGNFLLPEVA